MFKRIILASFIIATPAAAQQSDPLFLQRAISSLQVQRNSALDSQAVAEARIVGLQEDLNKANAKIKELEEKLNPPKDDKSKE